MVLNRLLAIMMMVFSDVFGADTDSQVFFLKTHPN